MSRRPYWGHKVLHLLLIESLAFVVAAGSPAKKPKGVKSTSLENEWKPQVLNTGGEPVLRYPVWRQGGLGKFGISYGWLDISRTRIRYGVIMPAKAASESFEVPLIYTYDPRLVTLDLKNRTNFLAFYGGSATARWRENVFRYLPQDRWGTLHTSIGIGAAIRRGQRGTESMVLAMKDFDLALATVQGGSE